MTVEYEQMSMPDIVEGDKGNVGPLHSDLSYPISTSCDLHLD